MSNDEIKVDFRDDEREIKIDNSEIDNIKEYDIDDSELCFDDLEIKKVNEIENDVTQLEKWYFASPGKCKVKHYIKNPMVQ